MLGEAAQHVLSSGAPSTLQVATASSPSWKDCQCFSQAAAALRTCSRVPRPKKDTLIDRHARCMHPRRSKARRRTRRTRTRPRRRIGALRWRRTTQTSAAARASSRWPLQRPMPRLQQRASATRGCIPRRLLVPLHTGSKSLLPKGLASGRGWPPGCSINVRCGIWQAGCNWRDKADRPDESTEWCASLCRPAARIASDSLYYGL